MKIGIISFTRNGADLAGRLVMHFRKEGNSCSGYGKEQFIENTGAGLTCLEESVTEWTEKMIRQMNAIIYIGAVGIAVRAIAPFVKDKLTDPAVVVVDEQGKFSIALLSGHVGGANQLAEEIACVLGAIPVITTASDVQRKTAVDLWAANHGLILSDRVVAKQVAAAMVNGENVGFYSDFPVESTIPKGYVQGKICSCQVWITCSLRPEPDSVIHLFLDESTLVLRLIPKALFLGVGCRKGVSPEQIEKGVKQVFEENNLDIRGICGMASIDIKEEEKGLIHYGKKHQIPFQTFSSKELKEVAQVSEESEFVEKITGVGNVCERAAILTAGEGAKLLVKKCIAEGITVAVAIRDYTVTALR